MKENYGNLESLKKLGESKSMPFTLEQLIDQDLKNIGGESNKEVKNRMNDFFSNLFNMKEWRSVAIVSHGASIKFFATIL